MPDMRRVYLARQGVPRWEGWWVEQHGHTRAQDPNEDDLVGFANFDLRENDLPQLTRSPAGDLKIEVEHGKGPRILNIIRRHGFEFIAD